MTSRSQNPSGFRFPPEISCSKEDLPDAPAYVFRHQTLGLLGRIVLRDTPRGRTHMTSEVAGDPLDPYTAQRTAALEPLIRQILRRLDEIQGAPQPEAEREEAHHTRSFGESKERIASQLIPCDRCAKYVALLIFAPGAVDAGHFEDYARLMYPEYSQLNLPTWIVGPEFGGGSISERSADMLKVWPERESIIRQQPATLKAMIDQTIERHCG